MKLSYLAAKVPITKFKGDCTANAFGDYSLAQISSNLDHLWLDHATKEHSSNPEGVSWAAFYASNADKIPLSDISSLFPVWRDNSKSSAMLKHSLDTVKDAVEYLTGQTPAIAFDQPLFALAKKVQWHHPHTYRKLVTMMGPLEMAFMSTLGDILKDSCWKTITSNAQIAQPGVAESLVSGHGVVRTKYIQQLTAPTLHQLQHQAHMDRNRHDLQ